MWFESVYIDGFGLFHDQALDNLPNGLVVFLGKNESGKSTLMEFLRTVLFGPPREGNVYPPLRGGTHGGRVQVVMRDGRRFTIERYGKRVAVLQHGAAREHVEPSQRLFPGVNREMYRRVFAVGLDDMQKLDILTEGEVRDRLFAASGGLGAGALVQAVKSLDERMRALLRPRASEPTINKLLDRMRELSKELDGLRSQSQEYAEAQRERERAEMGAAKIKAQFEEIGWRLRRIEQLEQSRPAWLELEQAQARIAALEFARTFPEGGWERLEQLEREIEEVRGKLADARDEARRWGERLASIQVDRAVLDRAAEIQALAGESKHLSSALNDLPSVMASLSADEESLAEHLRDLGPDWDAERLGAVDASLRVRQQAIKFETVMKQARQNVRDAEHDLRAAEEALSRAERDHEEVSRHFADLPVPRIGTWEELRSKRETAGVLRAKLQQLQTASVELREKRERNEELVRHIDVLRREAENRMRPVPAWVSVLVAVASGVGVLLLGQHRWMVGMVGFGLAAAWYVLARQQAASHRAWRNRVQEDIEAAGESRQELVQEIRVLEGRLSSLEQSVRDLSGQLGLSFPVTLEGVERVVADLEGAGEELRRYEEARRAREEADGKLELARRQLAKAKEALEEARRSLDDLLAGWRGWLSQHGFSPELSPEELQLFLGKVEAAREAKRRRDVQQERVNRMSQYLAQVRAKVCSVYEACGKCPPVDADVGDIAAICEALEKAREAQREWEEASGKVAGLRDQIERLENELAQKENAVSRLLSDAGVPDRDAFRCLRDQREELRKLEDIVRECNLRLATIAGTPEAVEGLVAELRASDPARLGSEKESLERRREELEEEYKRLHHQVGELNTKLGELSTDRRLSEKLLEHRTVQENVRSHVRQWAVFAACRALVDRARQVYERERQPEVVREARSLLDAITGGKYVLSYALDRGAVTLQDAVTLVAKDEGAWSRGLADQVFLAVRLALAKKFGQDSEPLPVMLDDVMVNFDPERRLGAARVVLEFARHQQVLLFSCHPDLLSCLALAVADLRIDLGEVPLYMVEDGLIRQAFWPR